MQQGDKGEIGWEGQEGEMGLEGERGIPGSLGKRGASRLCLRHYPCDECSFNAENSSELKKHF